MINKKSRWFAGFGFSFLICLALSASAVVPPVEKLLPDDTLFMVTTPDFVKLREIYHSSPQTKLWDDPAMKPFKEHFLSKMREELIEPLERDLNIKFADYTNLPQGQITLAMAQNGWPAKEGQHPGLLLLIDTKDKSTQLTKNIADIRKKWVDAGKTVRTEKIRSIEFAAFPISDKDVPKTLRKFTGSQQAESDSDESTTNATKSELFIGQYESLLVVGTETAPIEKVLAHVTGGSVPSLGDLATYDQSRLAVFRDSPFYAWVNSKILIDALTHQNVKVDPETPDPMAFLNPSKIVNAVGIGGVKTLAFSVQVQNDGTSMQVFASAPESSRQGILKILPGEAKDSSPPSFVPADAVKFQRWRLDGQKTWATIQKIASDISPSSASAISLMLGTANEMARQKDPDFDINKAFFGNLGDDVISYQKAPRGNGLEELSSPPTLYLIASPKADQLASALKYILGIFNPQAQAPKDREFLGRKIYSIPPGSSPMGSFGAGWNYAASGGYVAISTDASLVEEYLRSSDSEQKTLRETPGLTDAMAKAGGSSTGMFGFENQLETTRAVFGALKSGATTNFSSGAAVVPGFGSFPGTGGFKDWMDFSLLPPFDSISKYFGISVYTASANVDGMAFKMFAPVPAALRK